MEEKDTSDFKIGIDDESQEHRFQEEMENTRIKKLSNRITFISILIPCLIGVIIFLAYLDIKKRVATVHDTGTTEVKNLSKDLEEKLSDLTSKYKQLEDSFSKIENHTSSLQTKLNEATTATIQHGKKSCQATKIYTITYTCRNRYNRFANHACNNTWKCPLHTSNNYKYSSFIY